MDLNEIKGLIETQGKAFEEFKKAHAEELKKADTVTTEKLSKIEASLDAAVEAKTAIEAKLEAERKEREEMELRLSRMGQKGGDEAEVERKAFNTYAGKPLSTEEFAAYKSGLQTYLRKGEKLLEGTEAKAMSVGGDPDGGYLVTPDMGGRIVSKVYETSNIRQIASVQVIGTDALEGIEDLDEAGAGWVGETATRSDTDTPQVGKWKIEAFEMYAMPKATQKLLDDASVSIEAWLAGKVADRLGRLENAAFVTGNGVGKPRGFTSYTTAADTGAVAWGQIGHIVSGANGSLASADNLINLVYALKDAYLGNARFVTRRSVISLVRKLKSAVDGQYYWQPALVAGEPERIMGYPVTRAEDMPALATNSLSLGFGDFRTAYQIVDRTGIRVLRDPYTDKPYVKFYTTKRTGGAVVNFEAIKLMKFST